LKNVDVLNYLTSGAIIINNNYIPETINKTAEESLETTKANFKKDLFSERLSNLKKIIDTVINNNIEFDRAEIEIIDKKKQPITIGLNINIIQGNPKKYLIIFRNISEIKELKKEIELQKRLAILGRMAAGISHELRNPLGSVRGLIEISILKIKNDYIKSNLNMAIEEIDVINNIITDVLNFAKPWVSKIQKVNIHKLIEKLMEHHLLISKRKRKNNIHLKKNYKKNLNDCYIDKEGFKIIFSNIFINAIHAVKEKDKPEISITTNIIKDFLFVEIKDNGYGIPEDKIDHILMPFYSTKFDEGTGLGLGISKKIIDTLKGKLYIDSVENEWSTFIFLIPIKFKMKDGE
jgi:signal transduction histidine kinase